MFCPSGGALTSTDVPVMPPAPARFSITTGWPSVLESDGLAARMIVSTPEPGLTGRMTRIGACARADGAQSEKTAASTMAARRKDKTFMVSPDRNLSWSMADSGTGRLRQSAEYVFGVFTDTRKRPAYAR